jgi:hypothetical protein
MNTDKPLRSWEDFLSEVAAWEGKTRPSEVYPLLFRGIGLASDKWDLKTSLERTMPQMVSWVNYLWNISLVEAPLNSHTGSKWNVSEFVMQYIEKKNEHELKRDLTNPEFIKLIEFMVHLRHCGYPSPLLDWTRSPYVAAYFAFSDSYLRGTDKVSIFAYQKDPDKDPDSDEPRIETIGPNLHTHKRHFLQQAEYSMAVKESDGDGYLLCSHEETPDAIVRYTLPVSERERVLQKLRQMNITEYSLFATEDALVKTIAMDMMLRKL